MSQKLKRVQHLWETQEKERKRLADFVIQMRVRANANDKVAGPLSNAVHVVMKNLYKTWLLNQQKRKNDPIECQID